MAAALGRSHDRGVSDLAALALRSPARAQVAGRQLHLYTFGLEDLAKQLNAVEAAVAREAAVGRRATAGALWCALRAAGDRVRVDAPSPGDGLAGAVERAVSSADSARAALKALEGRPLSPREVILFAGAYVVAHAKA